MNLKESDYTVLFCDDEVELSSAITLAISGEGYNVHECDNGESAIEFIKNNHVDILIVDYFMPDINGEEVVRRVREFNNEIVIILQTAYSGEKPPLEMLKHLDIQGYHDKSEGIEKLLLWVAATARVVFQKRITNKINEDLLIEQSRLSTLGELTGGICHNMKTPIFSISACVLAIKDLSDEYRDSIGDKRVSPKDHTNIATEIKDYADKISQNINFLNELICIIKEQSIQNKTKPNEQFSINEVIKKVTFLLKDELKKYLCSLNVQCKIDGNGTKLFGKIINLVQVLNNLILNACHAYDNQRGKIDLIFDNNPENPESMLITVRDYACGISGDIKEKLLKEMVTTKGKNGTGLGVYTSNTIIKDNFNGKMWFESEKDKGTAFYISIPKFKEQ